MTSYMLQLSYDGTAYAGWQQQINAPTVAGMLQKTFQHVFKTPCTVVGASRTDAGVHAYDQVARIQTELAIDPARMHAALNSSLPSDIHIRSLAETDNHFHPQYHVAFKEYWYTLALERPLPFDARFCWPLPEYIEQIDLVLFEKTLKAFEGMHDFTSFARVEPGYNPVRSVQSMTVASLPGRSAVRVIVRAEGFLRFQVRRMVGAALMVAREGATAAYEEVVALLKTPQRTSPAFFTVPGRGLCLQKIVYKKELEKHGQ